MALKKRDKKWGAVGNRPFKLTKPTTVLGVEVLPQWMFGDPAVVAERTESALLVAEARRAERTLREHRETFGLVGKDTVRLIKRARIRELVQGVLGDRGKKR